VEIKLYRDLNSDRLPVLGGRFELPLTDGFDALLV
jgi:hypothetical protein